MIWGTGRTCWSAAPRGRICAVAAEALAGRIEINGTLQD